MSGFIDAVGSFAPLVVFLLAAAESAVFAGLVVPGELAVILGGVAAGAGRVPLLLMIAVAIAGAIVGDSIGYRLGNRWGPRVMASPRLVKVSARMDRATHMLSQQGWWALVVARFAAVLRAVVPFAAGMGSMPYRRFVLGNAVGGLLWGSAFTLLGYFAGANYPRVEHWFRTGGLVFAALGAAVGLIVWATKWTQRNHQNVAEKLARLARRRPFSFPISLVRGTRRPLLTLTLTAAGIVAGLWVFGGLLQDVIGSEEFFFFDISAIRYLDANRLPELIAASRAINSATAPSVVAIVGGIAAGFFLIRRHRRLSGAIAVSTAGSWVIVEITRAALDRTPPDVQPLIAGAGYGFPSLQVAMVSSIMLLAAWPWVSGHWRSAVFRFGVAATIIVVTGFSRVILLVEYPSDVIAGVAVAVAWTLMVCAFFSRESSPGRGSVET